MRRVTDEELIKKYVPEINQEAALAKLKTGYPVQYLIGNVDFGDTIIEVNENVLIPRFETEELVSRTLKYLKKMFPQENITLGDLATGSGCIAIALKKALGNEVTVKAFDISAEALEVAKMNALKNNTAIQFYQKDIRFKIPGHYDCLICNPPYIALDGWVEVNVKKYEPALALYAANDGLEFYQKILSYAFTIVNSKYLIAFEIGADEKKSLDEYLKRNFAALNYHFEKDLNGLDRYLFIYRE